MFQTIKFKTKLKFVDIHCMIVENFMKNARYYAWFKQIFNTFNRFKFKSEMVYSIFFRFWLLLNQFSDNDLKTINIFFLPFNNHTKSQTVKCNCKVNFIISIQNNLIFNF